MTRTAMTDARFTSEVKRKAENILKELGIPKDEPSRLIPFEAKVIAEYLDTARLREMHRAALAESIGKGNAFGPQRSNEQFDH